MSCHFVFFVVILSSSSPQIKGNDLEFGKIVMLFCVILCHFVLSCVILCYFIIRSAPPPVTVIARKQAVIFFFKSK